jgi:hypothetical protein
LIDSAFGAGFNDGMIFTLGVAIYTVSLTEAVAAV